MFSRMKATTKQAPVKPAPRLTHSASIRSAGTLCALIFSDPHCNGCLTNKFPLLYRHFPAAEKKGSYQLLGKAVLSLQGAVRRSTL